MKTINTTKTFLTAILLTVIFYSNTFATVYETKAAGSWTSSSTWVNGTIPSSTVTSNHSIIIKHSVTFSSNLGIYCPMTISSSGNLNSTTKTLSFYNDTIENSGILKAYVFNNYAGTLISTGNIYFNSKIYNAGNMIISGTFTLASNFENNGGNVSFNTSNAISISGYKHNSKATLNLKCGNFTLGTSFSANGGSITVNSSGNVTIGNYFSNAGAKVEINAVNITLGTNPQNNSGGVLNLTASGTISISGILSNNSESTAVLNGTTTISTDCVVNSGSLSLYKTATINKNLYCWSGNIINYANTTVKVNLEFSKGATITNYGTLNIIGKYTNSNGSLIMETTDSTTGNLLTGSIAAGTSLDLVVNRKIKANGWHYVSSPISNTSSNVFTGAALYSYDETTGTWKAVVSNETLQNMKGYDAYYKSSAKEISFSGKVNDGSFSLSLTNTVKGGNGYNLVGNPYPSSIDWNAATGWTKTNIDNAVYFWDDKSQNISSYVSGLKSNEGSNIIPATMAFFVKCNKTTGGTLGMTNSVRVAKQDNFRNDESNDFLKMTLTGNGYSDEAIIGFNAEASNFYDGVFDAEKMFSYNIAVPQIYTTDIDFQTYAINVLPETGYAKNISLSIKTGAEGKYSISINTNNLNQATNLFVEDTYTNTIHDVKTGAYNFTSEAGEITDRFVLHFVPVAPVLNNEVNTTAVEETSANAYNVFSEANSVMVFSPENSSNAQVFVYNSMGQLITSSTLENGGLNKVQLPENTSGCMIVSIVENNQVASNTKVIVK